MEYLFCVKMPDAERPYKAFGYPFLPMLYIITAKKNLYFFIDYKILYLRMGSSNYADWYSCLLFNKT